jgi:hypothetical protein
MYGGSGGGRGGDGGGDGIMVLGLFIYLFEKFCNYLVD